MTVLSTAGRNYACERQMTLNGEQKMYSPLFTRRTSAHADEAPAEPPAPAWLSSKTVLGQGLAAGLASCWQVYSGGIVVDTVSTRLQAGQTLRASLYGGGTCYGSATRFDPRQLFAGHAIAAYGRFPYLCVSLNAYARTEALVEGCRRDGASIADRGKTAAEEAACIGMATALGSAMITMVECPKVLAQCSGGTHSLASVYREHGFMRLLRGYDACFLREGMFQVAMFGSVPLAAWLETATEGSAALRGHEQEAASFCAGLAAGFLSNGPDQLKTRVQDGQFRTFREAFLWQMRDGGGLRALHGRAAAFRAIYAAHAVLAVNFMRFRVESFLDG